jgi:hypothetical protein
MFKIRGSEQKMDTNIDRFIDKQEQCKQRIANIREEQDKVEK